MGAPGPGGAYRSIALPRHRRQQERVMEGEKGKFLTGVSTRKAQGRWQHA